MSQWSLHTDDPLLARIRSEFLEMPGLSLTIPQASRLWNLDPQTSQLALEMLVHAGVLQCTDDGRFMAAGDGVGSAPTDYAS
ncbi:MAG: hypothetical protein JSU08_19055 [Acidobacteria bacterium]|nr:hypothetical protein [Acidobacteriota bacterium]